MADVEKIHKLEDEVKMLKSHLIKYRNLFMADGVIDQVELSTLDALDAIIQRIEKEIEKRVSELSWTETAQYHAENLGEGVGEVVDAVVDTTADIINETVEYFTGTEESNEESSSSENKQEAETEVVTETHYDAADKAQEVGSEMVNEQHYQKGYAGPDGYWVPPDYTTKIPAGQKIPSNLPQPTWCNRFAMDLAETVLGEDSPFKDLDKGNSSASTMNKFMEDRTDLFEKVETFEKAWAAADQGKMVFLSDSGHIATCVPTKEMQTRTDKKGKSWTFGEVIQAGASVGQMYLNYAWSVNSFSGIEIFITKNNGEGSAVEVEQSNDNENNSGNSEENVPADPVSETIENNSDVSNKPAKKLIYEDIAIGKHGQPFIDKVKVICSKLGLDPNFMMATMKLESKFEPAIRNPKSNATGLIQFMPSTAKGLGTTVDELAKMSALDQLDWVEKYYKQYGSKISQISEPAESYLLVFYPAAIGKSDDYILGSEKSDSYAKKVAEQNHIYDLDGNGYITKGEVMEYQRKHNYKDVYLELSQIDESDSEQVPATEETVTETSPSGNTYTVKSGDTLEAIASKFDVSVEALKDANRDKLKKWGSVEGFNAGETIVIPSGSSSPTTNEDQTQSSNQGSSGVLKKPNWISIAEGEIGTKEIKGSRHNPRVIEYHATTGLFEDDETPWCSSFVNWVMKKAGHSGTNSAKAITWANWGQKVDQPAYGAIAVIDWDLQGPGSKGHVGFVVGKSGGSVQLLGGNQSDAVNISNFSTSKIIAYVFPSNYLVPTEAYTFGDSGSGGNDTDMSSTR